MIFVQRLLDCLCACCWVAYGSWLYSWLFGVNKHGLHRLCMFVFSSYFYRSQISTLHNASILTAVREVALNGGLRRESKQLRPQNRHDQQCRQRMRWCGSVYTQLVFLHTLIDRPSQHISKCLWPAAVMFSSCPEPWGHPDFMLLRSSWLRGCGQYNLGSQLHSWEK